MSPLDDACAEDRLEAAEKCVAALIAAHEAAVDVMPVELVRIIEALSIKSRAIQKTCFQNLFL